MERSKVILLAGTIVSLIGLGMSIVLKGKKRKYVIIAGCIIDIVLFLICRNVRMLFYGVMGGLLGGLVPGFGGSLRKYNTAVKELGGVRNLVIIFITFFTMILMTMAIVIQN